MRILVGEHLLQAFAWGERERNARRSEQQPLAPMKGCMGWEGEREPGSAPPLVHLNSFAANFPARGND